MITHRPRRIQEEIVAGDTTITVVGNLTADPELRFTPSGAAVANFTVASTPGSMTARAGNGKTARRCSCGATSGGRPLRTSRRASPAGHG